MALNSKVRRHDGRVSPRAFPGPKEFFLDYDLEPQIYWNDWIEHRDGLRYSNDRKMIRSKFMRAPNIERWNKKLKLLISRRKAKKEKVREKLLREKV